MGLSLVACSSNEPEEKVEEKKIEETKVAEEKEEKVKEEKKEEEKAKAAEEEKEKDSTIISYANKKVRVTLPKDLTSFHTPAREISRYSYMEQSNVLGYSLYAKDRTFTISQLERMAGIQQRLPVFLTTRFVRMNQKCMSHVM